MTYLIRSHTTFMGPNVWYRQPVTHVIVDAGPEGATPPDLGWAEEGLVRLAEEVHEGSALGPLPLAGAANSGSMLACLALNLQRVAGIPVVFHFGRPRPGDVGFDAVVQHRHAEVGRAAIRLAVRWLGEQAGSGEPGFDLLLEFGRFVTFAGTNDHGEMGRALAAAAERREIPATLIDPRGRIVELGDGCHRKRYFGGITSATPATSTMISRDKYLANCYLRAAGLPVPASRLARSLEQALAAARSIGYPVVLKPVDQGNAIGVVLNVRHDDDLRARFESVASTSRLRQGEVIIERFVRGKDYRATVVGGAVIAVSQRLYPGVTGDGTSTIQELIDRENMNPRRGTRASSVYRQIVVDDPMRAHLDQMGHSLDEVPAPGQEIVLALSGHRRDGAIHIDVTDRVHPANAALLTTATSVVGLDMAGIDLIATDIAQPILETGGALIELNEGPAFNLQLFPGAGPARDPAPALMELLFPLESPVRVPVVAVAAEQESDEICQAVAELLADGGRTVGLATGAGVTIGSMGFPDVDGRNPNGPRTVLNNPDTELAVFAVDAQSLVEQGLGFGRCDVAVVYTNSGMTTPFGQPVERVLLDALEPNGLAILNGADSAIVSLAAERASSVICVGLNAGDPRIDGLRARGYGMAISARAANGGLQTTVFGSQDDRPLTIELPAALLEGRSWRAAEIAVVATVWHGISVTEQSAPE